MNLWHDIKPGTKESLNVIIEIPKLSRIKYELDKETGLIIFDRVLYSPMHYPANYGFVPQTLWEDGDPLDVLVLGHEPLVPGCLIKVRPIGVLEMNDSGEDDAKILAVPEKDPRFGKINSIEDIEPHFLDETRHFFQVYKELQKKKVVVGEWMGRDEAIKIAEKSMKDYAEKMAK
ncbi:MAG: inorganic diphosphatase [Patescibacteria group bacterium]